MPFAGQDYPNALADFKRDKGNPLAPPVTTRNGEPAYYAAYESGPRRRTAIRIG